MFRCISLDSKVLKILSVWLTVEAAGIVDVALDIERSEQKD